MPSAISNLVLLNKCKRFIAIDPSLRAIDSLVKDALVSSEREIRDIDRPSPLAWLRESYNALFTRTYAEISAITQADPGVITAESLDEDIDDDHGFSEDDIVFAAGIDGMDELNMRLYRFVKLSATTGSLKQLNDQIDVVTTNYDEYSSGGYIYHAGIKIPNSTIEPSNSDDWDWLIHDVFGVTFDLKPSDPISEEAQLADAQQFSPSGRPRRWRYARYGYGNISSSPEHFLHFTPTGGRHNIGLQIEKSYPDLSTWSGSGYSPHPPEVHDAIWHRALSNLATNAERQQRSTEQRVAAHIEVLFAQTWHRKKLDDEAMIRSFSRRLIGDNPSSGPNSGWKA